MKRNNRNLRTLAVTAGIIIAVVAIWMQKDMRIVLGDACTELHVQRELLNMNPQNPEEFKRDWSQAMELVAENHTIYVTDFHQLLDQLTTQKIGYGGRFPPTVRRKPWATDSLLTAAWYNYAHAGISGYFDRYASKRWSPAYFEAYGLVNSRPYLFWLKFLSSVGLGSGGAWLVLILLPYLIIFVLCTAVVGHNIVPPGTAPTTNTVITQTVKGGTGSHQPVMPDLALVSSRIGWLILWVMLFRTTTRDRRRVFRTIRTMSSRAPPKKEVAMRRFIVLLMLTLVPATAWSGTQTADLVIGEWSFGQGAQVSWTYESGPLTLSPSGLLDGSAINLFTQYDLVPDNRTLAPGVSVGGINGHDGVHPYIGPGLKLGWTAHHLEVVASYAAFHQTTTRMVDLGLVDITRTVGPLKVGGAYQPIRTTGSWMHRGAVHGAWVFREATVTFETRQVFSDGKRTSMHIDVSVPIGN